MKRKGNEYFKKGDYENAIACYSRSIDLDPKNALSLANRAQAYLNLSKYFFSLLLFLHHVRNELAEKDCTAALLLDPKFVKAYLRRGTARLKLGLYKQALEGFHCFLCYIFRFSCTSEIRAWK